MIKMQLGEYLLERGIKSEEIKFIIITVKIEIEKIQLGQKLFKKKK